MTRKRVEEEEKKNTYIFQKENKAANLKDTQDCRLHLEQAISKG
jgi:hypothetical protein